MIYACVRLVWGSLVGYLAVHLRLEEERLAHVHQKRRHVLEQSLVGLWEHVQKIPYPGEGDHEIVQVKCLHPIQVPPIRVRCALFLG